MRNNKFDTWFWTILFLFLVGFSAWQVRRNGVLETRLAETAGAGVADVLTSVSQTRAYELSIDNRRLVWPDDMTVLGGDGIRTAQGAGSRLVLAVNEVSCGTCRDEQTAFVQEVESTLGQGSVSIVVGSQQPRYALSYMRLNQIEFPVFYNQTDSFFRANGITDTPVLLLLNEKGEVISSHYPLPEKPILTRPFHNYLRRLFGMNPEPGQG